MKAIFVIFISLLIYVSVPLIGQEDMYEMPGNAPYSIYLGSSVGINSPNSILGFFAETPLNRNITFNGHLGLGVWGLRYTLGGRYYKNNYPSKLFYSASFSGNTGIDNLELELETSPDEFNIVHLDLKPTQTINLTFGYQFAFAEDKVRFHMEGGYAIPTNPKPWKITDNQSITETSELTLDLLSPGGIILSFGLSIGFFQ